ncbi:transposase [Radiobacillus sp. PE A8.2]|uniref:transposase n=1 Tax=Radiobacillus sp. PE A8.2 TaxID=3380349 RepID=UPI00388EE16A
MVQKLTEEQCKRRDAFLQKKKQKGKPTQSASQRNAIQILVTNVTQEYLEPQELYPLYSLRWQVEILFKTWKSLFEIDHVRTMKQERFECHLYGTLIRILLSSMMAFQCRYLLYQKHAIEGSEYKGIQQAKQSLPFMARAISKGITSIIEVIKTVYENVCRHGKKEHRSKHISPFDILNLSYEETFSG